MVEGGVVRALVGRFYEQLWNCWDDAAIDEVLAADFSFRGSLGQETTSRDGWRGYRDQIRRGSSDFHNEVLDLVVADDRAAARLCYSGTHSGPLLDIAATGRRFSYYGAAFFTVGGECLTAAWVLGDLDGLRRQLS